MATSFLTCAAMLRERSATMPDRLAYAFGGERLSYGELHAGACDLARGLAARGVVAGDRVAFLLPAGLGFVRAFWASTLRGAVPFAISPTVAAPTAIARAARGRPALVLTTRDLLPGFTAAADRRGLARAAIEALTESGRASSLAVEPPIVDPESPLVLQLTSGTTGEPRLAVISHRAIAAWRAQVEGVIDPGPDDVLAGWVPPWHITGLLRFVALPPFGPSPCHLVKPEVRELGRWLETAAAVRATYSSAPDFALRAAVRSVGEAPLDLSSFRVLTSGGEAVRLSTIVDFERRFDLPGIVRPGYGLAEASLAVTLVRPGEPLAVDARGAVANGRPLPGVELALVDERGEEVATGGEGEIRVRCAALFSGYFDDPASALTADGWLATGDWGRLDEEGRLFVVGRRRLLLKHGGATYSPREIEEAAESVTGVAVAAVVALAEAGRERAGGAVVAVEAGPAAGDAGELAAAVAAAVRRDVGLLPHDVLVLEPGTLPRTESGKLRHLELRRRLADGELDAASVRHGRAVGWAQ